MKQLPPFGEYLSQAVMRGTWDVAIIFMGAKSYERALSFQDHLPYTLCLPPGESPFRYNWTLTGCEVYLVDTSDSYISFIKTCAKCFFAHGATQIRYISRASTINFKRS